MNWLIAATPLEFLTLSLWRDEAFSYLLAKQPFFKIFSLTAHDFNPPLYYLLLHVYMYIFGHSEIALRAVSLLFYYGSVYVAYQFVTKVFGIRGPVRWAYLALFAANPFLIYYAMEARMYSMSAFLAILGWYYLLTHRPRRYMVVAIIGIYTHYFFMLLIGSQLAYMLLSLTHSRASKRAFVGILIRCAIAYIPWILYVFFNRPPVEQQFWIIPPSLYAIINTPAILLLGYEETFMYPAFSLIPTTLAFMVAVMTSIQHMLRIRTRRDMYMALAIWALIPAIVTIVLSPIKPLFLPRYLIVSAPGIILMLIYMINMTPKKLPRYGLIAAFIIITINYNFLQILYRRKDDFRTTITQIKRLSGPRDLIYVDNELNYHVAQYYFDPSRVYIYNKPYSEIPAYVGRVLIPPSSVAQSLPRFPARAFILHSDLSYDIQSIY